MNIGGGLGIPYREDEASVPVESIARMLRDKFDSVQAEHPDLVQFLISESTVIVIDRILDYAAVVHGEWKVHDWSIRMACHSMSSDQKYLCQILWN